MTTRNNHRFQSDHVTPQSASFHNPSQRFRVAVVAGVLAVPGALGGALASLLLGHFILCAVAGGLIGAILGAAVEAWPSNASQLRSRSQAEQDFCERLSTDSGEQAPFDRPIPQ